MHALPGRQVAACDHSSSTGANPTSAPGSRRCGCTGNNVNDQLDPLRTQLADIDRRLIELISERQKTAAEIGRIKQSAGLATRNFRQERDVLDRARGFAEACGVSGELAETTLLTLIEASLAVQEQDRIAAFGSGEGGRALIIGGSGRLGRWLCRFLAQQGYQIEVADPTPPADGWQHRSRWDAGTLDQDLIVVAAPLQQSADILQALCTLKPQGLVFDVGSLKTPLRAALSSLHDAGVKVTSVHPMFGPSAQMLSGKHVIFINVGNDEAVEQAKALFDSTMATQVEMDIDSHDRLIAYVLGLSHATNLAFVSALAESGETARRLDQLSSTTFDSQLDIAASVAAENPHLYFEIQYLNDYGTEALSALLYAVEKLRSVVRAGDERGFTALMERCRQYVQTRRQQTSPEG